MDAEVEDVASFRLRAREWLGASMPRLDEPSRQTSPSGRVRRDRDRRLQRLLWDGGFAGICFPAEYGGLGLTPDHQQAFTEESLPYQMPLSLNVPTLSILAATLVDFGTHAQKARHLPAILRGDELWVQFLSEPTGGSDLAGCITRADRDGDVWVLNGSKIWSSAAMDSDYAMCLARTNWEAPKHRGLTVFVMKIHQPGVHVEEIRQVDGSMEFCQEFFTDVVLPADAVVGEVDHGWTVVSRLLLHERTAVGGGSPYSSGRVVRPGSGASPTDLVDLAREVNQLGDPHVGQLVAEDRVLQLVSESLASRVTSAMRAGEMVPAAGSILKLFSATSGIRRAEIAFEVGGVDAVVWSKGSAARASSSGRAYPSRQSMSLGGGSNEIQRNIISERVLGMPREWAADRDVAYREVKRNVMPDMPPRG